MISVPPIFNLILANVAAKALLGTPLRVFSFGEVVGQPVATPYVVWQTITGSPFNCLGDLPDQDAVTVQVDVYATAPDDARKLASAVRDALEGAAYLTSGPIDGRELDTNLYRITLDFDFILAHNA